MEKIRFTKVINAPREKVWKIMLDDATYREWTHAFHPGSYYQGSWEKGSEIRFLGPSEDGKEGGMYSMIEENKPFEFISIKHLGEIKDGKIDPGVWEGVHENYTFTDKDGGTELLVELDTVPEYKEMFEGMWPVALEKLKEICER